MNPKTEEILKMLRFEASIYVGSSTSLVCEAAADLIERLQQELVDERYRHDRLQDFCVAQGDELSRLKAQQRWIPVGEKKPNGWLLIDEDTNYREPEEYIVHVEGSDLATVAHCIDGVFEPLESNAEFCDNITHWMPLPEPPKEG